MEIIIAVSPGRGALAHHRVRLADDTDDQQPLCDNRRAPLDGRFRTPFLTALDDVERRRVGRFLITLNRTERSPFGRTLSGCKGTAVAT